MTNMSIQPLWLTYFIEILLVLEIQLTETYFGTFSYKAHFRPQISSNGKNRSLKQMSTYMLEAKTLPPKFWAEAINYASYIQNRMPHKHLYGMTPFKAWSGHKPDVTHFRIFGSRAWARIPTEKRKALHPKSQEFLFVGYSKE